MTDDVPSFLSLDPGSIAPGGGAVLDYERADVEKMLRGYAQRLAAAVDNLHRTFDDQLRSDHAALGTRLRRIRRTLADQYGLVRNTFLPTMRAHLTISEPQLLTLLAVFNTMLRIDYLWHRYTADQRSEITNLEKTASEFAYVVHANNVLQRQLDLSGRPLGELNQHALHQALTLLVKTVHRAGATQLSTLRAYWDALYHAYVALLDAADNSDAPPAAPATPTATNPLTSVSDLLASWGVEAVSSDAMLQPPTTTTSRYDAELMSEAADVNDDMHHGRLTVALPFVHGGRRIRLYYLQRMESIYYHHWRRFQAVDAFERSVQTRASTRFAHILKDAKLADALERFLDYAQHPPLAATERLITENMWNSVAPTHLMVGEVEHFVLDALDEFTRNSVLAGDATAASVDVSDNPRAEEVISALRTEDYTYVSQQVSTSPFKHVAREFLPLERIVIDRGIATASAPLTEPKSVALLLHCVTAAMAVQQCPMERTLKHCAFIDELHNGGFGGDNQSLDEQALPVSDTLPPETPAAAYERYGQTTGAALVRLMRRNFVVTMQTERLRTFEMPALSMAIVVWLACARTAASSESAYRFVPEQLVAVVKAIRAGN